MMEIIVGNVGDDCYDWAAIQRFVDERRMRFDLIAAYLDNGPSRRYTHIVIGMRLDRDKNIWATLKNGDHEFSEITEQFLKDGVGKIDMLCNIWTSGSEKIKVIHQIDLVVTNKDFYDNLIKA